MNHLSEAQNFWDHAEAAQKLMRERTILEQGIGRIKGFTSELDDVEVMFELADESGDSALQQETELTLEALHQKMERVRLEAYLSGEADQNHAFLEINAGAGGTEAQDWAQMMLRMYIRWAESKGYKIEWIEENAGEEAGIKSTTIKVSGPYAYGWLKTESGVHRLVRISPYDANARRHTSFASVWVYPEIDDSIQIDIQDKDLRIDTFRASGAGGQHVNKTESAIRITHMPTGIVVQCQNDRSQHRNRAQAFDMLRSRLYELEMRKREEAAQSQNASKTEIGWGHQIRSYVLQPYQMVKDLRTSVEKGNAQGVLDGDIDAFLEAALAQRAQGN
ncbi:MAG: peptide chain release factor 2 [Alphaproteobacteria bacterium 43-37]|nr:MAG: peptide chain release factor 2 [Alphaproteobacteria bacterium 43-37]